MELKDTLKILKKHKNFIVISMIFGLLFGLIISLIPPKYISSGSLYVKRSIYNEKGYFTYEGYYAQQSAQAYTNSVIAILESLDIKKNVLELSNIPVNDKNIRGIDRAIKVKKTSPQMILISVKDKNYDTSVGIWDKTVNSLIGMSTDINKGGDENLGISLVSDRPVVRGSYRSAYLFGVAGLLVSFTLSLFTISIKEYLKN